MLGHLQRLLHFQFVVGHDNVEALARPWRDAGSNAWAVSPKRSASGHALLVANPHLPWSDLFTWFEAQLVAPGIDATGAAQVGQPLLGIAFNESLGWTHTVNTHDGADLYELSLADGGYLFDGAVRPFDESREIIKVRQPNGSLQDEALQVKRSVHGPVVSEKAGKALALRVVGLDQPNLGEQYLDMIRAGTLEAFEAAERRLQMPMFTTMYADRAGNILHLFGGRTPVVRALAALKHRGAIECRRRIIIVRDRAALTKSVSSIGRWSAVQSAPPRKRPGTRQLAES